MRILSEVSRLARKRRVVVAAVIGVVLIVAAIAFAATSGNSHRRASVVGSAPTTTGPGKSTTSATLGSVTTIIPSPTETPPSSTAPPAAGPQPARADDFTGTLEHWREICDPCVSTGFDKGITLTIRNATDHPIDLSTSAPVRVAVVCATNMTADGRLTVPLPTFPTDIFVDESITPSGYAGAPVYDTPGESLAPGAQATNSSAYGFGIDGTDAGTATCEGALVATSDETWKPESLSVVARLSNVATYSFQVVPPAATTTTKSSVTSTS